MIACNHQEAQNFLKEIRKCSKAPAYFLDTYCQIYDATSRAWLPFRLWPAQLKTIQTIADHRLTVILKARQLGLTWLVLGYALWLILVRPAATVLLFSRRDEEAVDLLRTRLRGMYDRLPDWLKVNSFGVDNDHEWQLSNGSRVLAFPTTAGDSYTATLAVVDEADLVPDLDRLMRAVKPTIDGGGRMVLLSRADKTQPQSPFKRIFSGAKQRLTEWVSVFLPWNARPDRDQAWYDVQKTDVLHRTGSLDDLHEQYPTADVEALAPRSLDKRIAPEWLRQCYIEAASLSLKGIPQAPAIPGLVVYALPQPKHQYVVGADPAEGNPTSDDSALEVLDKDTGEEVASLAGKLQPAMLAAHAHTLAKWYNHAGVLVERNNHGHAVLLWLSDHSSLRCLRGHDGKEGWLSSQMGKVQLYDRCADAFRNQEVMVHTFATYSQLASIHGSTLRAPEGEHDDRADAFALACAGRATSGSIYGSVAPDPRNRSPFADFPKGMFVVPPDEWRKFLGLPPAGDEDEDYPLMEGHPW
jgi:hypothetical protein